MNFLIVTHVKHKHDRGCIGGYGPYVREMNLWLRHVDSVRIVAPIQCESFDAIDLPYEHSNLIFVPVPSFSLTSPSSVVLAALAMPIVFCRILLGMLWADHIHLRCPGNMGLLGCVVQILFPGKRKTAKYAGNWDQKSKQPWSYRLQQWLLANSFLTHNMQTLVYGQWPGQTQNIKPFFTATYHEAEVEPLKARSLDGEIKLVFVGGLTTGKQPLLAVQTVKTLIEHGHDVSLELMGEGPERSCLESFVTEHRLGERIRLLGNVDAATVKNKLQQAHFLIFLSKSEGWPKAVAEAMFWGCVPITTRVSCVPFMLGDGSRGTLIKPSVEEAVSAIEGYLINPDLYPQHACAAAEWSRQFTLEKFEQEIIILLHPKGEGFIQ